MPTGSRKDVQSVEDGSEDEERQRCPICLNEPRPSERAVPDSCSHVYCLSCILRWAQVLQICPVDRRLFSSIYTQNPFLGYIRIPVKSLGISNHEGCGCKETVENISKAKKTKLDENGEGRVNQSLKCDTDSSAVKKNKMKRETCSSQLLAQRHRRGLSGQQGATLSMLNQVIIETELMSEEEPEEKSLRPYRSNQWLPVPISSPLSYTQSILLRQCPRAPPPLPLQPVLPTSPCPMGSGFPDLHGKICPVTCPKGPGRSGTRGSGSKGPGKKVENVRTTRSTRSRRGQNVTEESSSQSQQSGSCSPAGSDPNDVPASTSRQRNVGKKKAPTRRTRNTRKNASPQPVEEHEEESTGEERIDEPLQEAGTPEKTQADSPCQANEDVNKDVHSEHDEEDDQVTENEDQQNSLDCGSVSPPITGEKKDEDMEEEQNKQLEVDEEPEWVEKEVREEEEEAEEKVEAEVGKEGTEEKVEDEVEEKETEEKVEDEVEEKETEEKVEDEVEEKEPEEKMEDEVQEKETEEKVEEEVEEKETEEKVEDEVEEKETEEKVEDEDEEKETEEKVEDEDEEKEPLEKMENEVEQKEPEEKMEDEVEEKETEEKVENKVEEKEPEEKVEDDNEKKEPEKKMEVEEKEPEDEVEEKESGEKMKDEVEEKETKEKVEDEVEEKVEKELEDETKKKVEEKVEDEMEKEEKETVLAELEERGAAEQEDDQTSSQMKCSEDEPEVESVSPKEECKSSSPSAEQLMTAVSTDPPNTGVTSSQDIMGLVMEKDPTPDSASKTEPDEFQNTSGQVCKTPELESPRPTAENGLHKDTSPSEKTLEESNTAEHLDNIEPVPMDCDSPSSVEMPLEEEMVQQTNTVLPAPQTPTVDQTSAQEAGQKQNPGQEQKSETSEDPKGTDKTERRQRKSRFHSPTTTWSPKNESRREAPRRSRSRSRERSRNTSSPRRNRGRDHDEERGSSRRNRSRERWGRRRTRSRSRNRSRSRSRSRSRNKPSQKSSSPERNDQATQSPRKRESWGGDDWRGGGHSSRNFNWRNNPDRPSREPNFPFNGSHYPPDISPDRGPENPPWVKDRRGNTDSRDHREQHWEDKSGDGPTDSWSRGGWGFDQGRPGGRGRGGSRAFGQFGESVDNGRQQRNAFSGTAHNSGGDSYSHFNDNRPGGKRKDNENTDMSLDRSGWSAASSWAVRRKLPADVQNYYSRRDRGTGPGGSIWNRQEDEQPAAGVSKQPELPQSEPNTHIPNEAVPAPPTVLPPQLNMLGVMRFPVGPVGPMGLPGAPISIPPPPFSLPTQIPVHMPPPGPPPPSLQIPVMAMQSLPPPPPPPPPVQQATVTILQTDSLPQVISTIPMTVKAPVRASPNKAPPSIAPSVAQPSSTTQSSSHSKAHADSSKKEKKLQIQEKAITEVKNAIKPYYQNKDITKDEYKEIVRKAVEKICHSKSGEVNTSKVANLVKAYVDKYKHARKNKEDKN